MTDLTERLRWLLADATPGPWHISHAGATIRADKVLSVGHVSTRIAFGYDGTAEARANDFRLITELRNNADDLLTTLETLTQENARLREALEGCEGIESGPNGRGGMRVVVHFPNGGDETALFHVLNSALAARKALGGGDE
ncbi:hypothetical protein [uncultured Sphingomonas sp.]|uniref:hypothetical protein n=1 Tax=uncultured Sphingomonas sp. TaxID=158754 RepID=UPI003749F95C